MADNITDEELGEEIARILKTSDLASTTSKKVIEKLEKKYECNLKPRKKVIDKIIMEVVNRMESGSEEESEEEEKPKPKAKAKPKKKRAQESDDDDDEEEEKKPKVTRKKPKVEKNKDDSSASDKDEDGSDWGSKKKKPAAKKGGGKGGKGKGSGYTRAYKLSPALAELMGEESMPRHEVVKRMWALIKEKQLYDPNSKQFAICDNALYKVIGTQRFRIFGMMKYLKTHFLDD